jgi:hypothetical protein
VAQWNKEAFELKLNRIREIYGLEKQFANNQNRCVSGLCPSPGILKTRKQFRNWIHFCPEVKGGSHFVGSHGKR